MKHIGLFEGIGGFSLAARWAGWETIAWCEWNEFGQRVLRHHFPEAIGHGDITKTDFTPYADTIDILTGGFPCQPYSLAGKRKGKDDERHLWPEMLRAIREIRPRWVVGENVFGLVNWSGGLVFHEVQADLEAAGYEVWPYVLPAAAVNAPHRRDRIWFVAYTKCNADGLRSERGMGMAGQLLERCQWKETANGFNNNGQDGYAPHPNGNSTGTPGKSTSIEGIGGNNNVQQGEWRSKTELNNRPSSVSWDVANTDNKGLERGASQRIQRNEGGANRFFNAKPARFSKQYSWQNFPTQSPICTGDDGLSSRLDGITFSKWRNESIKAAGNAIVPQVAYQIFKAINQMECL